MNPHPTSRRRRGCLFILSILGLLALGATLLVSTLFTETQAGVQNATARATHVATRTASLQPTTRPIVATVASPVVMTDLPPESTVPALMVTIEAVEPTTTLALTLTPLAGTLGALPNMGQTTAAEDYQRDLTRIANYQSGVQATYTEVARKSEIIFLTLTAQALGWLTPTPVK